MLKRLFEVVMGLLTLAFLVFVVGLFVTATTTVETYTYTDSVSVKVREMTVSHIKVEKTITTTCESVWSKIVLGCEDQLEVKFDKAEISAGFSPSMELDLQYQYYSDDDVVYMYFGIGCHEVVDGQIVLTIGCGDDKSSSKLEVRLNQKLKLYLDEEYPVIRYQYSSLAEQMKIVKMVEDLCQNLVCVVTESSTSAYAENGSGGSSGTYVLGTGHSEGWTRWSGQEGLIVYGEVYLKTK